VGPTFRSGSTPATGRPDLQVGAEVTMKYPRTFVVITTAALLIVALVRGRHEKPAMAAPPLGTPGGPSTSQADLERTVTAMKARLANDPSDTAAAVSLADALLR